ncbi:AAA family ATPase [Nocardioides zeae]|uniref:AAA family ATPase n=1 Tax=Nocardioides imazamoxiresistens TaxID=3231893 RepID=A0ABU3PYI0_9ACTN|nr:AAA family ATPase [Nocardioides zeae]MDT9594279.1 AAA family ATPase [Nocardioides zeae]
MLLNDPSPGAAGTPGRPRRFAVAGVSGVGKTTLARGIAARLGVPHTETDALFHGPGWTPRPEFLDDVRAAVAEDAWVMEWLYSAARPVIAGRADVLVWLDLPTRVTMTRVVRRTLGRRLRRTVLWNGNVEQPLHRVLRDPDHIVRWAWRTRHKLRDGLVATTLAQHPHLQVVWLRSRREAVAWLDALGR